LDELVEKNISLKSQVNEKEKEFNDKTCFH
jgi:hypothetical protein